MTNFLYYLKKQPLLTGALALVIALLVLYWKTRNIWACGLLHFGFDFFNSISLICVADAQIGIGSYVSTGSTGLKYIINYVFIDLIMALIAWRIWRKVGRTIDFDELRKSW